jgi:WD40-like Beta Propeller Repeat
VRRNRDEHDRKELLVATLKPDPTYYPSPRMAIAFASDQDANYEIYSMDPDGSNQTDLTRNSAADFDPAVSPDGKKEEDGHHC